MKTRPSNLATRARPTAASVSSAERAIHEGEKTIGEISKLVNFDDLDLDIDFTRSLPTASRRPAAAKSGNTGGPFSADSPLNNAPLSVVALPDVAFFDQELWGLQLRVLMPAVMGLGFAAGICIGYALYGTPMHAAIIGAFPFLG
ncbi:hypothetical protein [Pseudomonas sp. GOM6]|uniref:hypothetical protein n=1 Tax=Pseudomonas sp. GOM6 TaxID=3036944 RepID=UPI00240A3289|nr:hypothetical protein [Pseudomonas sp. GOM6]MDG1580845.1 hypothetical protein [Pseudomonas sp. GOM6]